MYIYIYMCVCVCVCMWVCVCSCTHTQWAYVILAPAIRRWPLPSSRAPMRRRAAPAASDVGPVSTNNVCVSGVKSRF